MEHHMRSAKGIALPAGARLESPLSLVGKLVLSRYGHLAFVAPWESPVGRRQALIVELEGQSPWRSILIDNTRTDEAPDTIDLAIDRIECVVRGAVRQRLSMAPPGALGIDAAGTHVSVLLWGQDPDPWLVSFAGPGMDVDHAGLGMVAKEWTLLGFRAGELVLEHQVTAIEAT